MTERTLVPECVVSERDDWVSQLERLVADAEAWSEEQDWLVEREEKPISESSLGTYTAPALKIRRPDAVLLLEPSARDVVGALGCVDFSVFPSFEPVMVVLTPRGWRFAAPEKKGFQGAWSRRNFLRMADDLEARRCRKGVRNRFLFLFLQRNAERRKRFLTALRSAGVIAGEGFLL